MLQDVPPHTVSAKVKPARPLDVFTILKNRKKDSRNLFSSRIPNQALICALIDGGKVESEGDKDSDHDLAVSYIDGWKPAPWKGQIWRAPKRNIKTVSVAPCVDLIWSGRDWLPYTGLEVIDKPFTYPEQSKASVGLIKKVNFTLEQSTRLAPVITDKELNDAYSRYVLHPLNEEDNLKVTLYAYIRGTYILKQARGLLVGKHNLALKEDDIVMDFTLQMLTQLGDYKHSEKMGHWVKYTWKHYFFKKVQRKVIEYTDSTKWMNDLNPEDDDYQLVDHCVGPEEWDGDAMYKRECAEVERFSKELLTSDPKSPWFQLSDSSKEMLQARLKGETNKQTAKRLGCTPQHLGRLTKVAIEEAKQVNDGGGL